MVPNGFILYNGPDAASKLQVQVFNGAWGEEGGLFLSSKWRLKMRSMKTIAYLITQQVQNRNALT